MGSGSHMLPVSVEPVVAGPSLGPSSLVGFLPAPDWEAPPTFFPKDLFRQEASYPPPGQDSPSDTQPWLRRALWRLCQGPEASLWFPAVTGNGNALFHSGFWPKRERGSLGGCLRPGIWPEVRMLPGTPCGRSGSIRSLWRNFPAPMKSFIGASGGEVKALSGQGCFCRPLCFLQVSRRWQV